MTGSLISMETINAYKAANYRVFSDDPFILKIGQPSADLHRLSKKYGCDSSVFITACNPYSQIVSEADNTSAQDQLASYLIEESLSSIKGQGEGDTDAWPGEESFLVFGISLTSAKSMGVHFMQNAIVWNSNDSIPQLILLR